MYTLNTIYEAVIEVDFGTPPDEKKETCELSLVGLEEYAIGLGVPDNNVDVSVGGSRYRLHSVITVTGERVDDVRRVAELIVANAVAAFRASLALATAGKTREGCAFI